MDFLAIVPSVTGKVELVYEGEQEGASIVAENLIGEAVKSLIDSYLPSMDQLKSSDKDNPYTPLVEWFGRGNSLDVLIDFTDKEYHDLLDSITPLKTLIEKYQRESDSNERYFLMEMVLWALAEHSKLNKEKLVNGYNFADLFSSYLRGGNLDMDLN